MERDAGERRRSYGVDDLIEVDGVRPDVVTLTAAARALAGRSPVRRAGLLHLLRAPGFPLGDRAARLVLAATPRDAAQLISPALATGDLRAAALLSPALRPVLEAEVLSLLASGHPELRRVAVIALGHLGAARYAGRVRALVGDSLIEDDERLASWGPVAAAALARMVCVDEESAPASAEVLADLLDAHPQLEDHARAAFERAESGLLEDLLRPWLDGPPARVRLAAAAMGRIGLRGVLPWLLQRAGREPDVAAAGRLRLFSTIGRLGGPMAALELLLRWRSYEFPPADLTEGLARCVHDLDVPESYVVTAAQLVTHPDAAVRFHAVRGLGRSDHDDPTLTQLARAALDDPAPLVRGAAALAVARRGASTLTLLVQAIDRAGDANEASLIILALVHSSPHHSWVESLADRLAEDGQLCWSDPTIRDDMIAVCRSSRAEAASTLADAIDWLDRLP